MDHSVADSTQYKKGGISIAERITIAQVKRAFSIFTKENRIPTSAKWYRKKGCFSKRWLKLDYNPYYGGWRMDWVNPNTSESFFHGASRRSTKEMYHYLWGLIEGRRYRKKK